METFLLEVVGAGRGGERLNNAGVRVICDHFPKLF